MKLNVLGRIMLALLLIFTIVFAFILLGMSVSIINAELATMMLVRLYDYMRPLVAVFGAVLLLICGLLLFCGRSKTEKTAAAPASTIMQQNEIGGTYIALDAIDSMVQKHCRAVSSVRDVHTSLRSLDDGVSIGIRLSVVPDTDIATLTQQLQVSLKEYIQSLTGISVKEIGILVESAAEEPAKRVE